MKRGLVVQNRTGDPQDSVAEKFTRIGAHAKLRPLVLRRRQVFTGPVRIDIREDARGEYFDLELNPDQPTRLRVLDVQAADRHLLLKAGDARFLCGHDERHWFVAAVPEDAGASSVREAKEALMPKAARDALEQQHVKRRKRHLRRNEAFIRQGEWFFIPDPTASVDPRLVLTNEPLRRGEGKPHTVQYLYRDGGETVYVSYLARNGLTEAQYADWLRQNPDRKKVRWSMMRRNPRVFVRGKVRHPDHKTVRLGGWHRVEMNTETKARAMRQVAFLD